MCVSILIWQGCFLFWFLISRMSCRPDQYVGVGFNFNLVMEILRPDLFAVLVDNKKSLCKIVFISG